MKRTSSLTRDDYRRLERFLGCGLIPKLERSSLARGTNGKLYELRKSKIKSMPFSHYFLSISRNPNADEYIAYLEEYDKVFMIEHHTLRTMELYWDSFAGRARYIYTLVVDESGCGSTLYGKKTPEGRGINVDKYIYDLIW